jgi:hypothetical protein
MVKAQIACDEMRKVYKAVGYGPICALVGHSPVRYRPRPIGRCSGAVPGLRRADLYQSLVVAGW